MKLIKIISINFIVLLIVVILLEFIIIQINKNKIKCSYVLCNYNITYENKLYEPFGTIVYKKDKYGFRGRVKDVSKIDILVFGGSTTDERYLNLNDTWAEQLEKLLKKNINNLDIVNAGIDGQSTFGHIWNFKNWINKIENFETKFIFFYIGINDTINSGLFDMESTNYQAFSLKNKIKFNIKKNNAFIFGVYKSILKIRIILGLDINPGHRKEKINKDYYIIDNKQNFETDESFRLKYTHNIEELTRLSKKIGAEPIFITQRTLQWFEKKGKIYNYGDRNHYKYELFRKNIIMEHCNKNNLFCIDMFNNLDLKNSDTYDLVHLTPSGSSKVAEIIEQEILKNKDFFDKLKN